MSGKTAYRTRGRALEAVLSIEVQTAQAASADVDIPTHAYRCRDCGAWHLTRSNGAGSFRPDRWR